MVDDQTASHIAKHLKESKKKKKITGSGTVEFQS
jgi:hypothetical protein